MLILVGMVVFTTRSDPDNIKRQIVCGIAGKCIGEYHLTNIKSNKTHTKSNKIHSKANTIQRIMLINNKIRLVFSSSIIMITIVVRFIRIPTAIKTKETKIKGITLSVELNNLNDKFNLKRVLMPNIPHQKYNPDTDIVTATRPYRYLRLIRLHS
jgi:hypothetical protein